MYLIVHILCYCIILNIKQFQELPLTGDGVKLSWPKAGETVVFSSWVVRNVVCWSVSKTIFPTSEMYRMHNRAFG